MSGSQIPGWKFPNTPREIRNFIETSVVETTKRHGWNRIDLGGNVTLKNKGKDFSPSDISETAEIFQIARTAINSVNQAISGAQAGWPAEARAGLARYFFIDAISNDQADQIRKTITLTQTMIMSPITIKIMDLQGTRAKVPQNTQAFLDREGLAVKRSWIRHAAADNDQVTYAAGIRFDRGYLHGSAAKDEARPPRALRAKTLIHEITHRACNTKDLAYFKDDGVTLEAAPIPPERTETELWLDNADSYGWFCVHLAGIL